MSMLIFSLFLGNFINTLQRPRLENAGYKATLRSWMAACARRYKINRCQYLSFEC